MKFLIKSCTLALLAASSSLSFAETINFEMPFPSTTANSFYPTLDLNQLNKVNLTVERNIFSPEDTIKSVKLDFANATDIITSNLAYSQSANKYVGTINGAWIYRQVGIEINASPQILTNENVSIRLFVVEQQSNINNPEQSFGPDLVVTEGVLFNVTPNPVIDSANVQVEDKNLNLRLHQRADSVSLPTVSGEGFIIDARWLGHGDRTLIIPAPYNINDINFKTVAINIESYPLPDGQIDHMISITYEDMGGYQQTTPFEPLKPLLENAYQTTP
ncbi:hypothetical protein [Aliikangiella sp. G2MR2-5]|uniref:hypothetical protein n=1 Tax=Aliikangiella sp. G2MR2-5 TaxID=2788943 RepID=UPI0018A8AB8A|nr:hypothetical protein [Aliikangiella sp. G2MR2-5]